MVNEFKGLKLRCKDDQLINGNVCPVPDGDVALKGFDMDDWTVGSAIGILIALAVGFRLIGYLSLRYLAKKL